MNLQETLSTMKAEFEAKMPPEIVATMHTATDELAESGILDKVLKTGNKLPAFTLSDERGKDVSSDELLQKGSLVISFYRGTW